jgi:hypothetical protein
VARYSQKAQLKIKRAKIKCSFHQILRKNRQIPSPGSSRVSQNTKGCLKTIYFQT